MFRGMADEFSSQGWDVMLIMLIKGRFLVCLLLSDMIRGFKMGARHVVKFPLCVFVVCISTLQDSSVSIFDQLSGLIADSLLCPPLKFRGLSN